MTELNRHNAYLAFAEEFDLPLNVSLKGFTSFKVGGPADILAMPQTRDELKQLLIAASKSNIPITLFGGGTNLLITDKGIRGLVIITKKLKNSIEFKNEGHEHVVIRTLSGQRLSTVCRFAVENSLSGIEFAAGIPGTIGGAISMNAGTPAGQMSDIVDSIETWNMKSNTFMIIKRNELNFSYRNLDFPGIIMGTDLKLKKGNKKKIKSVFMQTMKKKKTAQPVSHASAGCFFKNPDKGDPAGMLIEKAGLKGTRVNDAMVSKVHANYIVNLENASSTDILLLKEQVQAIVFEKFDINLETEVRVEGE